MEPRETIEIDGLLYYSVAEILKVLKISRQTLYKWRRERRIPAGHRYRNRMLVFSAGDWVQIREHANRIGPAFLEDSDQLRLFTQQKGDRQ